jgi:hypothetical protein
MGERPPAPEGRETHNQGNKVSAETRAQSLLKPLQQREGEPIDPYLISDKLMSYQDEVYARMKGLTFLQKPGDIPKMRETRAPTQEEQAFIKTIMRVRDAFDIVAFTHFPPNYQQAISMEVYDEDERSHTPRECITLTDTEKAILAQLTHAAGIADNPKQHVYSYGSIPRIVDATKRYSSSSS